MGHHQGSDLTATEARWQQAPFSLQELCGRVFLLNSITGDLWEIEREKFTAWNCISTSTSSQIPTIPTIQPVGGRDRYELVGTDTADIDGITYIGQVQPAQNEEPNGQCELTILQRIDPRHTSQILSAQHRTRDEAWAAFDEWVKLGNNVSKVTT